ncbi:MAG: NAD(P)/FAD-dependent oxidoreductase [Bacteroidales bacterium]|nr:NAD(P)/FAD-dependent oxidoreductase [Bacteroidales bacterium]
MKKKVIIIGGGISGLSTGSYLQMNGFDTEIYELHDIPGGVCTTWKRKNYLVDLCVHWFVGSRNVVDYYKVWQELLPMDKLKFVDHDVFLKVSDENKNFINIYSNIDKLEKELLEKAPEDIEVINKIIYFARKCKKLDFEVLKAPNLLSFFEKTIMFLKLAPFAVLMTKYGGKTIRNFADQCKNPLLKKTLMSFFLPDSSILFLAITLGWIDKRCAGYPIGGSQNISNLLEKRFTELEGKIYYKSRVNKILVKDNKAYGIILANGTEINADIVISCGDGYDTIYNMLEGKYTDEKIDKFYREFQLFPSHVFIAYGVSRKIVTEEINMTQIFAKKPFTVDDKTECNSIMVRVFNFDPTLNGEENTTISVSVGTDNYEYWNNLYQNDREKYNKEKTRVSDIVLDILDDYYGNIKANVKMVDISTPVTVKRYTNNWKGSFEGWYPTPQVILTQFPKTLPGLDNFYLISQWTNQGGGICQCAVSGRNITQTLCKSEKIKFTTTLISS